MVEDAQALENVAEVGVQILEVSGLIFEMTGVVTVLWKRPGWMRPHLGQSSLETGP